MWGCNQWCHQSRACRCAIQATSGQLGLAQQYWRGVSEENGCNKVQSERVDGSLGEGQFGGGRLELGTSRGRPQENVFHS